MLLVETVQQRTAGVIDTIIKDVQPQLVKKGSTFNWASQQINGWKKQQQIKHMQR